MSLVRLWALCRGGMGGYAAWPDAGGINDQAAWTVQAFGVLAALDDELRAQQGAEGCATTG